MAGVLKLPQRPMTNWELAAQLCSWSADLRASRRSHLDAYGKLVPHLFMADVLARVVSCQRAFTDAKASERKELDAILDVLESGARIGDQQTRNVIANCFIHGASTQPFFASLWPLLGPNLRALK